ncbi:MAG: TolC family protein, partial [Thiomicrorhabdus sp.]|nr:TolC family protein [Thiomicrorhabdus sp.]
MITQTTEIKSCKSVSRFVTSRNFHTNQGIAKKRFFSVLPLFFTASIGFLSVAHAQEAPNTPASPVVTLPNPLTLPTLLNSFAHQSPEITQQRANIDFAKANIEGNQVDNSWQANIQGRLGRRDFAEENQAHNLLALHVGKVIYDFERSDGVLNRDKSLLAEQNELLAMFENKQRLNVVKAYLNVLLADFQYRIDNEAMAVEYVGFDKVKDRHSIGQISDVDLLAAEQKYQQALVKRMQAEQKQLQTRIELANVLGMPNARPDELEFPKLSSFTSRSIKDISLSQLQQQVIQQNPQIKALQQSQQAQLFALENAQNTSLPTVRADAWVGQLSSYPEVREGNWKAAISVDVPLFDGGAKNSAMAKAQAQLAQVKAQTQGLEQSLRTQVADIYFQLKLLDAEKKQHQLFGDYADLYLDYSRALYENESTTDLGDAMVRLSEANYEM